MPPAPPFRPDAADQGLGRMFKPRGFLYLTAMAFRRPGVAAAAGISAGFAIITSVVLVPGADGILGAALALLMVVTAAIDSRYYIVPDELTLSALVLGLAEASIQRTEQIAEALMTALFRGIAAAMAFFVLRAAYRYLRGREGMGLGDVKLAGVAGVWLDWATLPFAVQIAALTGLMLYAARYPFMRYRMDGGCRLPFALFFAPSIWASWLFQSLS